MRWFVLVFALLFFLPPQQVSACEFTDEYKALRSEIRRNALSAFNECNDSVSHYLFWKIVADCEASDRGTNVAGGCLHIAGYEIGATLEEAQNHCEILKPSTEEIVSRFGAVVNERAIRKCVE